MHFIGTSLTLVILILWTCTPLLNWKQGLIGMIVSGYLFAWMGHLIFEKNRPATFRYPFYSLLSDFVMYFQLLTGRLSFSSHVTKSLQNQTSA
jgi:hypothetical protein